MTTQAATRPLYVIAEEITRDWKNVYFGAVPYLRALRTVSDLNDNYGMDSAETLVVYFLDNAKTYKGETARRVKAELKAILKAGRQ